MGKGMASVQSYTNRFPLLRCRDSLLGPLFKLLYKTFSNEWVQDQKGIQVPSSISDARSSTINYIQQTLLIILEDISSSLISSVPLEVCSVILKFVIWSWYHFWWFSLFIYVF